jgi:hypothetical protein
MPSIVWRTRLEMMRSFLTERGSISQGLNNGGRMLFSDYQQDKLLNNA